MKKHFYPAVFQQEDVGYSVCFPDLDGCFTEGDTLEEAFEMAKSAVGLFLQNQDASFNYPKASLPQSIQCGTGEFVVLIEFDELEYLKKHGKQSVKKTLTIPSWLNEMAEEKNVNFSQCLQTALKEQLNVNF